MQNYSAFTLAPKHLLNRLATPVLVSSNYRDTSLIYDSSIKWTAVWDTGATNSCVSDTIVSRLGLIPIGITQMSTANGTRQANIYYVDITLPNGVVISKIPVSGIDLGDSSCDLLLGMDIICLSDFAISNVDHETLFSFRIPSLEAIDYVKMQEN